MPKLAWVLLPLLLYAAWFAVAAARKRLPSRHALNIQFSLLLMGYLFSTAGLGIFWVANQQLPVFDWHYLFGYATLLLVSVHLWFNLPVVVRWLRGPHAAARPAQTAGGARTWVKALLVIAAVGGAYFFGGGQQPEPVAPAAGAANSIAAVVSFHEYSSESRGKSFRRTPGIDWGDAPPSFKSYPDAPHIALARGTVGTRGLSESLRSGTPRTKRMTLSELGDVLQLAAGVTLRRGGNALRAAPSSGALFPSELYVLAREVEGLEPGIYHFDPDRARLDRLGALPPSEAAGADATVVLTSVFRRTGYKYRNRAYRYVTADAGHLLENLRVAGQAAGFASILLPRFDEARLARVLGVDGVEEGVLAVMELRREDGSRPGLPLPPAVRYAGPQVKANAMGVTGIVHQTTSLQAAQPKGEVVALPAAQPSGMELRRVIAERRSKRRFTGESVELHALASILADMAQPVQLSDAVRINIVANRVAGLAPGVYRYDPRHFLVRVRSGDFAAAAGSAALSQDVIADAAVVLVLSAEREPMLAQGARGYRHAFIEAGLVSERWLLGAVARGLGACPVGAFYDDEAAALIGVSMRDEWVLHFAALGHADE
ncbi:MAG TPA: SagB/ThcOx family dehydrogenase [Telluria sp.]|nr:SagB/ThcOx family dehydrogenase [Telluria sp.]